MDVSVGDVTAIAEFASKVDPNPMRLAGRLVGLSSAEQKAGVPTWAWVGAAFVVGAVVAYKLRPQIERLGK